MPKSVDADGSSCTLIGHALGPSPSAVWLILFSIQQTWWSCFFSGCVTQTVTIAHSISPLPIFRVQVIVLAIKPSALSCMNTCLPLKLNPAGLRMPHMVATYGTTTLSVPSAVWTELEITVTMVTVPRFQPWSSFSYWKLFDYLLCSQKRLYSSSWLLVLQYRSLTVYYCIVNPSLSVKRLFLIGIVTTWVDPLLPPLFNHEITLGIEHPIFLTELVTIHHNMTSSSLSECFPLRYYLRFGKSQKSGGPNIENRWVLKNLNIQTVYC